MATAPLSEVDEGILCPKTFCIGRFTVMFKKILVNLKVLEHTTNRKEGIIQKGKKLEMEGTLFVKKRQAT